MCYMATVECMEVLVGSAAVAVVSPESVPADGMPYAMLLEKWAETLADPAVPADEIPAQLGRDAVACFSLAYDSPVPDAQVASILAIDLKAVPELLGLMDDVAEVLLGKMGSPSHVPGILDGPAALRSGRRSSDPDFLYLDALYHPDCRQAEARMAQGIIASWSSHNAPEAGLTAYLPERGPLPAWYSRLPIAERPFGKLVKRIVEGA